MRLLARWILGGFFMWAGLAHFKDPESYARITPLPYPFFWVYLSGVLEMVLGAACLNARTAGPAGIGLALLLVAIFPANVYMALHPEVKFHGFPARPLHAWLRLPVQGLLIAWALWSTRGEGSAR